MKESKRYAYEDILYLSHPVSGKHPPMSRADRAAQFSPFAALNGYEAAVRETARTTGERMEHGEYQRVIIMENGEEIPVEMIREKKD